MREHLSLLRRFLRTGILRPALVCALLMLAAAAAGGFAAWQFPQAVEQTLAQLTETIASSGVVDAAGNISAFGLLRHNWTAMLITLVYGFAPFIFLPAVALLSNGFLLGIMGGWYVAQGMSPALFLAGILPHGIFELSALVLSAACGVRLCLNMGRLVTSNPRRMPMTELLCDLLRVLLLVIAPLTVIAAFVEAYVTPWVMGFFL